MDHTYDNCVKYTAYRWFPVANMAELTPIKVYEYYEPGKCMGCYQVVLILVSIKYEKTQILSSSSQKNWVTGVKKKSCNLYNNFCVLKEY